MNRSTLFSVLLVGLLVAQGGAYGLSQGDSNSMTEASASAGVGTDSVVDASGFGVDSFASTDSDPDDSDGSNDSDGSGESEVSESGSESESATITDDDSASQDTTTEETSSDSSSPSTFDPESDTATDDETVPDGSESATTTTTVTETSADSSTEAPSDSDSSDGDSNTDSSADEEGSQSATVGGSSSSGDTTADADSTTTDDGTETDGSATNSTSQSTTATEAGDGVGSGSDGGDSSGNGDPGSGTTSLPANADAGSAPGGATADGGAQSTTGTDGTAPTTGGEAPATGATDQAGTTDTAPTGGTASGQASGGTAGQAAGGQPAAGTPPTGTASGATQASAGTAGQAPGGQAPGGVAPAGAAPGGTTAGGTPAGGAQALATGGQPSGAGQSQQAGGGTGTGAGTGSGAASPDADFEVVDSAIDAPVGGSGTLTVEVENTGEDAESAVVTLQSQDSALTFGGSPSASQFVGDWDEGDTKTIEVEATVAPGADGRSYPVEATISYTDDDGNQAQSAPLAFGVTPGDEQEFTLDGVDSSLSAGSQGSISGTITNEGPETATEAVLVFAGNASDVMPRQSEVVLGDIDSGESADFTYPVAVSQGVPPGDRQVPFVVQYRNDDGDVLRSETLNAGVTIDERADDFEVVDVSSDLEPGEQGAVEVTIENQREDLTDATINLQSLSGTVLFGESANASQFVGDWGEDETRTIEVRATAAPDATEGEYPMQASVSFTDSDNEPGQAGPFTFGVEVGESTDDFEVTDVDSDLEPGERGTVEVTLENTGEDATDATISLQSLSASVLFGETANASQFVGDWDAGETRTIEIQATAAQGTTVGEYPMQASVSYTDGDNLRAQSGSFVFGVPVGESADDFEVVAVDSTVPVGDEGTVRVTLNNTEENATQATVSLQSLSADLSLGPTANATQFVGDWDVGETRTVEFEVTASNETAQRSYPFQTSVSYVDPTNQRTQDGPYTIGVTPLREQAFTLQNVSGNLSVGDEGTVTGTVVNEGPGVARNAVLTLQVDNANVNPQETEFALGTLEAGESAQFSFPIEVTDSAEAGVRQLSFAIEYDNRGGNSRTSDTISAQVDVASERDEFTITRRNASLDTGATETIELEITNNRNSTVRNVNAKAFVDSPLSLGDDEAFVPELGPGESANITFEVSSTGSASPGTYPLSLDFQYDTAGGESKLSETYEVPIDVTEPEGGGLLSLGGDGGLPILPILLAVLLVLVVAAVVVRRRNGDGGDSGGGGSGGNGGDE